MSLGLVGRKVGMTRIFTDDGDVRPGDGARRARTTASPRSRPRRPTATRPSRSLSASAAPRASTSRWPATSPRPASKRHGAARIPRRRRATRRASRSAARSGVDIFQVGQKVDVTGTTHGKGFSGVIKRHHFSLQPRHATATRGRTTRRARSAWRRTRAACSRASAWRATWATCTRTTQNLEVVRVDAERGLLLVKGAVPGAKGGDLIVRPPGSVKAKPRKPAAKGAKMMELKLINDKGERSNRRRVRSPVRPRIQRGAGPPGRRRVPGQRPRRARARRRTAPKCATRPRSPGARKAPAARARA